MNRGGVLQTKTPKTKKLENYKIPQKLWRNPRDIFPKKLNSFNFYRLTLY